MGQSIGDGFKEMIKKFISPELEQIRKDLALIEKKLDMPSGSVVAKLDLTFQVPSRGLTLELTSQEGMNSLSARWAEIEDRLNRAHSLRREAERLEEEANRDKSKWAFDKEAELAGRGEVIQ